MKYLLCLLGFFFYGCASITTPTGGPKDEVPPELESSNPKNNEINFSKKTIELSFTEPIKLNNPKEEIIIVPPTGKRNEYLVKGNRVIITPETDWKDSTTYNINFQEAVQDITEGNPVPRLKLAFSTGSYIDSLTIEGKISEALKETIPLNITVAVFSADTFNIFKHAPDYFTKTDSAGKFIITNLKPGNYRIYAFEDRNKNLILESKSEKYAFESDSLILKENIKDIELRLVNVDSRPIELTSLRTQSDVNIIRLNKQLKAYSLTSTEKIVNLFGSDQSEIISYLPPTITDSLSVSFSGTDSLYQKIDTTFFIKKDKNERIKDPFLFTVKEPTFNEETNEFQFVATFNKHITDILLDSIFIEIDTTERVYFENEDITIDSIKKKLSLKTKVIIKQTTTPPDTTVSKTKDPSTTKKAKAPVPKLRLGKGFLITIDSDSSKRQEKLIKTLSSESTAILSLEIRTKEPSYIIELMRSNNEIIETRYNEPKPVFKYLAPESVKIRVIIDSNKNGQWDTANYLTNTEPERAVFYQTEDKKFETPLRANWELGPLVISF